MPKSISVAGPAGKPGQVYYALHLNNTASPPEPTGKELLVKIHAAAMNHRDLFVRQNLYPGVTFAPVPLMSDGCGTVVSCGPEADKKAWQGKRVIMVPGIGWRDSPEGPEDEILGGNYVIMGGSKHYPKGTLAEYLVIDQDEVEPAPAHMSDAEAAALPLTGLTAWRAVGVEKLGKRNAGEGKDVLVTGIGGGVALNALQFLTKMGTRVWVTSGSQEKLNRAKELGAAGGVNYKEEGWQKKLLELVEGETGGKKTTLDGIVDGAGGDIIEKGFGLIKVSTFIDRYDPASLESTKEVADVVFRF